LTGKLGNEKNAVGISVNLGMVDLRSLYLLD
jgi:hypothetical protein